MAHRLLLRGKMSVGLARFSTAPSSQRAANAGPAVAGIKHAARVMVPRRSGCIICTASTAGVLGGVNPAYCISKAAVIGAVRALAGELGRHGVRVNAISPHGVATPFGLRGLAELLPEASEEELRRMVEAGMNEMGGAVLEVEDIARAAVYLASEEARYVNGHNLVVDGGFTVGKLIHMPDPLNVFFYFATKVLLQKHCNIGCVVKIFYGSLAEEKTKKKQMPRTAGQQKTKKPRDRCAHRRTPVKLHDFGMPAPSNTSKKGCNDDDAAAKGFPRYAARG
ncbi:Xanthoxin dehydrogenase [Triticum urartu]|uniref:Xanthoxin dehydrogenase n=1 Tax=Triticum urartu TaxID=4572 RepID=M8ATY6_TRIUA|nr:Xanthoxin dehydrogenase [Triticum urartu]